MTRRLLNLLTVMSLLLCVVVVALWVRSYFRYDIVALAAYSGHSTEFFAARGRAVFFHFNSYDDDGPPTEWTYAAWPAGSPMARRMDAEFSDLGPHWWTRLGFAAVFTDSHPYYKRLRVVSVPLWFIALVSAAPPLAYAALRRRAKTRRLASLCLRCGYDLRATPGKCPECGAATVEHAPRPQ
jgi:hypothetical protein